MYAGEALLQGGRELDFKVGISFHRGHGAAIIVWWVAVKGNRWSMEAVDEVDDEQRIRGLSDLCIAMIGGDFC